MPSVDVVLRQAAADLNAIGARWAVIGGLAVAFRAEPRFTKDVDLAVAVADDAEAEGIVNRLQVRGRVGRRPGRGKGISRDDREARLQQGAAPI
jgi:hypothetical protein